LHKLSNQTPVVCSADRFHVQRFGGMGRADNAVARGLRNGQSNMARLAGFPRNASKMAEARLFDYTKKSRDL
jgi:hypothetical protein